MRIGLTTAAAVLTLGAGAGIAVEVSGSGTQPPRRTAPRPEAPAVRVVRSAVPESCGAWGSMTVEACREVAACDARKAASSDLDPLSAALERAIGSSLGRSCTGLSCGPAETRKDANNFACRGRTQLCMTRSLEYACRREAPTRTPSAAPPPRTPSSDPSTRAPSSTPQRTAPPPARVQSGASASADFLEPVGGSGQRGTSAAKATAATTTTAASGAPRRQAASGAKYLFPGKADELESGEYWYWKAPDGHGDGSQKYAYDLTSGRFDEASGKWTECESGGDGKPKCGFCSDAARNEDCLVYNEPLFAMASGVVERCWRNAPENPSPGESHPGRTSTPKRIGGGGNALVVRNDDGTYALYAHMRPGTIPASLCPKTKALMDDANDKSEAEIPEGQRPRVTAGQLVGRVGNTGASSNPHTHVHLQDGPIKSDDGVPLNFSGGFITDADGDYEDAWTRLSGSFRPTKTSAIWPNFSAGLPEIAYHGLPAATYQKLFDHAANSGYRLEWIDGFVVKGKTYFNVVFRPKGGTDWAASHNLTGDEYQAMVDKRKGQGMRLWHTDSYLVGSTVYYATVFVKDGKPAAAYHGATQAEHQKKFDEWTSEGWRPRSVSVTSIKGQRYYAVVYEKGGGYLSRSALNGTEYQKLTNEQYESGRQLIYLNVYEHDGQPHFSAIFGPGPPAKKASHGLSGAGYQKEWEKAREASMLTRCVSGYVYNGAVQYAAAWSK